MDKETNMISELTKLGDYETQVIVRPSEFQPPHRREYTVIGVKHYAGNDEWYGEWRYVKTKKLEEKLDHYLELTRKLIQKVKDEKKIRLGKEFPHNSNDDFEWEEDVA